MRFPNRERVIYDSNPLREVVFQIRFPRVLEIENRLPVEFQKAVAPRYPLLETHESVRIEIAKSESTERSVVYDFLSVDRRWKLALASDFIAISTQNYIRWEEFRDHLTTSVDFLLRHYSPAIFVRIGLRYINLIDRERLGIGQLAWHEIIRPSLIGIISEANVTVEDVIELTSTIGVKLTDGKVTIRHGLVKVSERDQTAYLIDSDFYIDTPTPADINDALRHADEFNAESGRVFRWCISNHLHSVLKPQPFSR